MRSGWLGDIGVDPVETPVDVHARFEVRLVRRRRTGRRACAGRVVMAEGGDAADVAFTTAFGDAPSPASGCGPDEEPRA